jgi:hypothetical protein
MALDRKKLLPLKQTGEKIELLFDNDPRHVAFVLPSLILAAV